LLIGAQNGGGVRDIVKKDAFECAAAFFVTDIAYYKQYERDIVDVDGPSPHTQVEGVAFGVIDAAFFAGGYSVYGFEDGAHGTANSARFGASTASRHFATVTAVEELAGTLSQVLIGVRGSNHTAGDFVGKDGLSVDGEQ